MEQLKKIFQCYNIDNRKLYLSQDVVMTVVGYNVTCIGCNGTVNKFVVIGVGGYQSETIVSSYQFYMLTLSNCIKHIVSSFFACKSFYDFGIFLQNLISDTKRIIPPKHRDPYGKIRTMLGDALNKAVSIENYSHKKSFSLFLGFLFMQPCMKVHLVDFVKTFLVKNTLVPKFIKPVVQLFGIVIADDHLQLTKFLFAFIAFKHLQKMNLDRIKYRCFHNVSN